MDRLREPLPTRVEATPDLPTEYGAALEAGLDSLSLTLSPAARAVIDGHVRLLLAWTEAITLVNASHVPDDVYERARQHFAEKELIDLTLAIVAINAWNRLALAFTAVPGTFQVATPPSSGLPPPMPSDA